jgi:hypothetical protein
MGIVVPFKSEEDSVANSSGQYWADYIWQLYRFGRVSFEDAQRFAKVMTDFTNKSE